MSRFGPTRGEHVFRLCFSLFGLALLIVALVTRGVTIGPALVEVVLIGGLFFGGSALWSARKLLKAKSD